MFVGVGVAVAEAKTADFDKTLPLLELAVDTAVTMLVGGLAVEAATMIPPAAVAAVGAIVVEAFSDADGWRFSAAWMRLKVSAPPPR